LILKEKIILASKSPFRLALLEKAGLCVSRETSSINERDLEKDFLSFSPDGLALKLAKAKAEEVSHRFKNALVIGCDQILSCEKNILHKVKNLEEARQRLRFLSGRVHHLHTFVAVYKNGDFLWQYGEQASLKMHLLGEKFIDYYLQQVGEEILAIAGICQIEGMGIRLLEKIEGDYHAIIGLPLLPLLNFLREKGFIDG